MEPLVIHETLKTPCIIFKPNGELILRGRSIPESVYKVYAPAISWLEELTVENVIFNINLEYINSASKVMLLDVFRSIEFNEHIKIIIVNWYYDSDDEEHFETGKIFEESTNRCKFNFIACRVSEKE
jgi:uncharacterized Fe-S radical SAM superfamily protein PflX